MWKTLKHSKNQMDKNTLIQNHISSQSNVKRTSVEFIRKRSLKNERMSCFEPRKGGLVPWGCYQFCVKVKVEIAFISAKRWNRRIRADLIESATPCRDAQVVGSYRVSNPLCLTILAAKSEDYTTAPQHLQKHNRHNIPQTQL